MPRKLILLTVVACGLGGGWWLSPLLAQAPVTPLSARPTSMAPAVSSSNASIIAELTKQQTQLVANQVQIEAQLAALKEDLRIARIYSSRTGGKTTP